MFNSAVFQENFEVNGGKLKTIVGNDVYRIVVMAKTVYEAMLCIYDYWCGDVG